MKKNKLSLYRPKNYDPTCVLKLQDWIRRRGVSHRFLCKQMDIDPSYLSMILSRKRKVTYTFWRKIVLLSKEELTYNDWDKQFSEPADQVGVEETPDISIGKDYYEDIDI